jgi:hypothetical protein
MVIGFLDPFDYFGRIWGIFEFEGDSTVYFKVLDCLKVWHKLNHPTTRW